MIFVPPLQLSKPGLFVTGTDTGVGKTVVSSAIAWALSQAGQRVGVCKPFATGCRHEAGEWISEDAQALQHFAGKRHSLHTVNPVTFPAPAAPAVAAEFARQDIDYPAIARSLAELDQTSDVLVIEGVGGVMVPLDPHRPGLTVLDLMMELDYPVLVVARAILGTLNHTALTLHALRQAGLRCVGVVVNGYDANPEAMDDLVMQTNPRWIERMNDTRVLAVLPRVSAEEIAPAAGLMPASILDAVATVPWASLAARPRR